MSNDRNSIKTMKFALDPLEQGYVIKGYDPGCIQINQQEYHQSLLLMPNKLITDWSVGTVDEITQTDIIMLAEYAPQVLLLGTGQKHQFIHPKILAPLMDLGIGHEVMGTSAACRTYNVLLSEGRKVLAALIP